MNLILLIILVAEISVNAIFLPGEWSLIAPSSELIPSRHDELDGDYVHVDASNNLAELSSPRYHEPSFVDPLDGASAILAPDDDINIVSTAPNTPEFLKSSEQPPDANGVKRHSSVFGRLSVESFAKSDALSHLVISDEESSNCLHSGSTSPACTTPLMSPLKVSSPHKAVWSFLPIDDDARAWCMLAKTDYKTTQIKNQKLIRNKAHRLLFETYKCEDIYKQDQLMVKQAKLKFEDHPESSLIWLPTLVWEVYVIFRDRLSGSDDTGEISHLERYRDFVRDLRASYSDLIPKLNVKSARSLTARDFAPMIMQAIGSSASAESPVENANLSQLMPFFRSELISLGSCVKQGLVKCDSLLWNVVELEIDAFRKKKLLLFRSTSYHDTYEIDLPLAVIPEDMTRPSIHLVMEKPMRPKIPNVVPLTYTYSLFTGFQSPNFLHASALEDNDTSSRFVLYCLSPLQSSLGDIKKILFFLPDGGPRRMLWSNSLVDLPHTMIFAMTNAYIKHLIKMGIEQVEYLTLYDKTPTRNATDSKVVATKVSRRSNTGSFGMEADALRRSASLLTIRIANVINKDGSIVKFHGKLLISPEERKAALERFRPSSVRPTGELLE